ncbi:MAG TPA: dicarboxylate/amino acid:cation symporter [Bacteroidia bacterium]|nr:dicarboxylate/amino acid:cation symporter [Bacteroidia bacterium]HRS58844.1 dicarboxylate/amino acid:cation symporter [Bacteroidia bacterium]HRU67724.1 dicarboxylate/amino acid:cation symporter [Bacteroidia bacterium]
MKRISLPIQILIALLFGFLFGYFFTDQVAYVSWIGELFIRLLKMIIIPLILASIISGVSSIEGGKEFGKLTLKTWLYYIASSLAAILTGLILVNLIQPGVGANIGLQETVENFKPGSASVRDLLMNIVPTNIIKSTVDEQMLSLIFFAMVVGFFINRIKNDHYRTLLKDLANAGFALMMKITGFIIKLTPYGVFAIMAGIVAKNIDNVVEVFSRLGLYFITVIAGLFFHAFITLPLFLRFVAKINPIKHYGSLSSALLTAFSTSSSSATLPVTMNCLEKNSGVSNKITSFVMPLGATVNMDGTALYECVAAIFIAQAYGIELSALQQIIIVFTSLLASIGAAGIPMAGFFMLSIILTTIGLPLEGVGLILAVDRILDMFRTAVNTLSDSVGTVVIAHSEKEILNDSVLKNVPKVSIDEELID